MTLYWGSFDTSTLQLARSKASEKTNKLHIEICEKMKKHNHSERICALVSPGTNMLACVPYSGNTS